MMAGSQLVHMYYKPLEDLEIYIDKEVEQVSKTTGIKLSGITTTKTKEHTSNGT